MVTRDEVRLLIGAEEPNYERAAAQLGADALPHLAALALDDDTMIAMKAVSLAGYIGGDQAVQVVAEAAQAERPELRVVAAAAAGKLGDGGEPVISHLLNDSDRGVRKFAVKAVPTRTSPRLREQLEDLRENEPDEGVRDLAVGKLREVD